MSRQLFVEGGAKKNKAVKLSCQEGFRRLLQSIGLTGRMPGIVACGPRNDAFDRFRTALANREPACLLVDSEAVVDERHADDPWGHLKAHDKWNRPRGATDEQIVLMTTCMETWIVSDRRTLRRHYEQGFNENKLPPLVNLELRTKESIHEAIDKATEGCSNHFQKGERSFEILAKLDPAELNKHLPSFARAVRILTQHD